MKSEKKRKTINPVFLMALAGILLIGIGGFAFGIPQAFGQAALQQIRLLSGAQVEILGDSAGILDISTRATDGGPIHIYSRSAGTGVYINTNNNVGIGTASPTARLDVSGNAQIGGALTVTGNSNICTLSASTTCPSGYFTGSNAGAVWRSCENGTLHCGFSWDSSMGYRFTPNQNGQITHLCGHFNGTRWVRLYDSAFSVLASSSVASSNLWACNSITPVSVSSGLVYYVVVELAGSGGCYRSQATMPRTCHGPVTVNNSVFQSPSGTFNSSHTVVTSEMYGMADIIFLPSTGRACCKIP